MRLCRRRDACVGFALGRRIAGEEFEQLVAPRAATSAMPIDDRGPLRAARRAPSSRAGPISGRSRTLPRANARRVRLCGGAVHASSKTLLERLEAFLEARDAGQLRVAHVSCVRFSIAAMAPLVAAVARRDRCAPITTEVHHVRSTARRPARAQLAFGAGIGNAEGRGRRFRKERRRRPRATTSRVSFHPGRTEASRGRSPYADGYGNSGSLQGLFGPLMGVLQQLMQMLQSLMGDTAATLPTAATAARPNGNERLLPKRYRLERRRSASLVQRRKMEQHGVATRPAEFELVCRRLSNFHASHAAERQGRHVEPIGDGLA